ncbi:hypothetical protein [Cupriavidus sp. UYPR2.512]|uniref:hypothetical protein n=1 Tax=Cupriavidus sp. UYPR2.512 TaxID=1080187 RepID=UPI00037EC9CB|nr:hypothetical protein [Cupriavidus sp. UYPR2.512]UIF90842.1 hypothetical protein KAF44_32150 [Cupriavidus necator]
MKVIRHRPDHGPLRKAAYLPVEDQLDALWHAMDRGEFPKVPEFYEPIKAVKDRYPKVEEGP